MSLNLNDDRNNWTPKQGDWVSGHVWEKNEKKLNRRKSMSYILATALVVILFAILAVIFFS